MKYLITGVLILLAAFISTFHTPYSKICYSANPSSEIVNNVYSSVVLITHKQIKTSAWDVLRFAAFVAGTATGTPTFGVGSVTPGHLEKQVGTGFQTKWGIVTNSHVMDDKSRAVLTTFHKTNYRIKKINRIKYKDKHIPMHNVETINATANEATTYDWGNMGIDLALIRVKIPGAFVLPLAKEVNVDEKVFTLGHPKLKKFTPATGSINRIYKRGGTKYIELFIKNAPGSSGSPVLNMKGEVVGVIWGGDKELETAEAVHVEEVRKAFGLSVYDVSEKKHSPAPARTCPNSSGGIESRNGTVYSTGHSRLFHRPDCTELIITIHDDLVEFPSKDVAIENGGIACPKCNP
jgi:hypothetical protein